MSVLRKIKLYRIKTLLSFISASWKNSRILKQRHINKSRVVLWFDQIFWFVFYGFDFNDYCTFRFWEKNPREKRDYISLRRNDVLCHYFCPSDVYQLFLDKASFNDRFKKFVKRGWIISEGKSVSEIEAFIDKYRCVIAKPLTDYGGHGVIKLDKLSDGFDARLIQLKNLIVKGASYIIEEAIVNVDYINKLSPSSLNTIRVVTVIDKNNELHIIATLLRMGNGIGVTDNYHDGGMACPINLDNGKLTKTAYGMNCVEYNIHPFSNIQFEGYDVPDINNCIDVIKEVAFYEPKARYVGWDLAVTPIGIELLEGNIPPGEDITQIATGKGIWNQMLNWK